MNNEVYAVYRDGFRQTSFATLEVARRSLERYKKYDDYYQLAIYRQNPDGSIVWVE
jgi:hypothetical protein